MNILSSIYGLAVCLEIFALFGVAVFLRHCIMRLRIDPDTNKRRRRKKFIRDTLLLMSSTILFFAGLALLNFGLFLQSYRTFVVGNPIAQISIEPSDIDSEFIVKIRELGNPINDNEMPIDREYFIRGDQWMVQGHLIRFHPMLSFLGFKPIYQLTRIQGSYYSIEDERNNERTVYSIINPSDEKWWKWMYKAAKSYPIIEMVHGSAVSQDSSDDGTYTITIVPTGFSLQKKE
jgi:hypothetical protein